MNKLLEALLYAFLVIFVSCNMLNTSAASANVENPKIFGFQIDKNIKLHKEQCRLHKGEWIKLHEREYACLDESAGFQGNFIVDDKFTVSMMIFTFTLDERGDLLFNKALQRWIRKQNKHHYPLNKSHLFHIGNFSVQFKEMGEGNLENTIHVYDTGQLLSL